MTTSRVLSLTLVGAMFGCSFINSFDSVNEGTGAQNEGGSPGTGGGLASGGAAGSNEGGGSAGGGGTAEAYGGGGSTSVEGPEGIIVVGGYVEGSSPTQYVLSVLSADDGTELNREDMTVSAVAYDGVSDRWYIFESTQVIPDPDDTGTLHIRTFDSTRKEWDEIATFELGTAVPRRPNYVVPLKGRLSYLALDPSPPYGENQLYTINTSAAEPSFVGDPIDVTPEGGSVSILGLTGFPSSTNNDGGVLNIVQKDASETDQCYVRLRLVNVAATGVTLTSSDSALGRAIGCELGFTPVPGWTIDRDNPNTGLLALPANASAGYDDAQIFTYNMSSLVVTATTSFLLQGEHLAGNRLLSMAYARCQQTALLVESFAEQALIAVPLTSPSATTSKTLGHVGTKILFEPYTNKVIHCYDGSGYTIQAFSLGGTSTDPTLSLLSSPSWNPPADLHPNKDVIAAREPISWSCN